MDNRTQRKASIMDKELEGIKEMRAMNQEYLGSGEGSKAVRDFLIKAGEDEEFLFRYLKGRKFRPKHAWETVKRNGEVRFDTYPEIFPSTFPIEALPLIEKNIMGVLKRRDSKGRRVAVFNGSEWDTEKYPLEIITIAAAHCAERMLLDEDAMNNGIIFVQDCSGMGMKHTKEYTLSGMLRFLNVFWYAYPLKLKGVYYVNVPYFLTFIYTLIKPFFPKKLKERFMLTSSGKKFEVLHERLSPDILPKWLGGALETDEATDIDTFQSLIARIE